MPADHDLISKALADPQRFAIFEFVCTEAEGEAEVGCKAIVARFPVSQATISHHLKELVAAGLIEGRKEGQCLMLKPKRQRLDAYVGRLQKLVKA
ncbi:MAG: metalloregulator ArsR/SmtB family transcription factor [Planctomycetota bacterium]